MKYFLSLIVTVSVLSTSLSAVEYGILHINPVYGELPNSEYKVTLNEGDYLEIISGYSGFGAPIVIVLTNDNLPSRSFAGIEGNMIPLSNDSHIAPSMNHIVGPCELFINTTRSDYNTADTAFINYKLTRASEVEYKNVNIISLPTSAVGQGTHEIVVEASDDLQTWTPVHSSSIGGNKTFFRTRVTEIGD